MGMRDMERLVGDGRRALYLLVSRIAYKVSLCDVSKEGASDEGYRCPSLRGMALEDGEGTKQLQVAAGE